MKRFAKRLKEYENISFDEKAIISAAKRLREARKMPTSVALEKSTLDELKVIAAHKGIPYQVLMRMFILEGLRKMKKVA